MPESVFTHAARLLREGADELKNCHALAVVRHDWAGEPEAEAAYHEAIEIAAQLERLEASRTGKVPGDQQWLTNPDDPYFRDQFEKLASDLLHKFRKSRRGTYVNPAVSRDWKWFRLGACVSAQLAFRRFAEQGRAARRDEGTGGTS